MRKGNTKTLLVQAQFAKAVLSIGAPPPLARELSYDLKTMRID